MKLLALVFCALLLAGCGGGTEPSTPIIDFNAPAKAIKSSTVPSVSMTIVQFYQAIYGKAPSNSQLKLLQDQHSPPRHNGCRLLRTKNPGGGDEGHQWHVTDNHSRTGQ